MKAAQFELEQEYDIERRRLINRSILGWGIARGFMLHGAHSGCKCQEPPNVDADLITVDPGLALDRHGREAVWSKAAFLNRSNTFTLASGDGGCQVKSIDTLGPGCYLLSVHYAEQPYCDVKLPDECGCPRHEKNFVCETAVFSLRAIKECPCGEPGCPSPTPCDCDCACGSSHSCLCSWTREFDTSDCGQFCAWNGFHLDPADGVPLACISICSPGDACTSLTGWIHDECTPRRILKNNELLYDLMRGGCLARIESLSWGAWHRKKDEVPWKEFVAMFDSGENTGASQKTNLSVTFTGPVKADTVTTDCFLLEFIVEGEDTGWLSPRLAPVTGVECDPPHAGDPGGTTRKATLCVDYGWFQELISVATKVRREGATVRISVNGDYILDCHGQAVDANARGFALQVNPGEKPAASGDNVPGGLLISTFRVAKDTEPRSRTDYRRAVTQEEEERHEL